MFQSTNEKLFRFCIFLLFLAMASWAFGQAQPAQSSDNGNQNQGSVSSASSAKSPQRRVPGQQLSRMGALLGMVQSQDGIALAGVEVTLQGAKLPIHASTSADGIFRLRDVAPGKYQIEFKLPGFEPLQQPEVELNAGEVLAIEVRLKASAQTEAATNPLRRAPMTGAEENAGLPGYRELSRRPMESAPAAAENAVSDSQIMQPEPDRWDINMPDWRRYGDRAGEFPYTSGHWWDPFDQNRFKGDKPIFGQGTFFNFTGTSTTALDTRLLYVPSGVSTSNPGSAQFFGKGGQIFVAETLRLSLDLFHGDTSFKPVDWRVRITPAFNVNQIWAQEKGVVNIDVREGTSRNDTHVGLQEAFVEKKLANLGPNYDFISVRAGIQQFTSDFRGLLFTQEQPGVRLFGNLRSNRYQYNAAYFWFLEKDTNSGLNRFANRHQQVMLANLYIQDFFFKGYTTQFSYHYNKDDASTHYDENGFLVRPAPIGAVQPHNIRADYIGWTGNGHIGRVNISHAAYQALGYDDLNPVSGRRNDINAQLGALELSIDKDWLRLRASGFYASGDARPRDRIARGFDSISEAQTFAGGIFSFFNREGIRLTGTGVALTAPDSFLPNLRSSKEEGQTNFVNPGIALVNAGADFNVTTKLKAVVNVNAMRFVHTEPLELLLFQSRIPDSIGTDYSVGFVYRPPLSENMVITSGIAALSPGAGLHRIYTGRTLVSGFTTVRFQF